MPEIMLTNGSKRTVELAEIVRMTRDVEDDGVQDGWLRLRPGVGHLYLRDGTVLEMAPPSG